MSQPDLNSILQTLSTFSNQTNNHLHQSHSEATGSSNAYDDNGSDYEPPAAFPPVAQTQAQPHSQQPPRHPPQPPQIIAPPHPMPTPKSQTQDKELSSTITTWPAALKQVMRTVAQSEDIQRRIRFLIQRQHDHERQWWKGREALLQKQSAREEKKRELDKVLYVLSPHLLPTTMCCSVLYGIMYSNMYRIEFTLY
jgi:hypothetical protein